MTSYQVMCSVLRPPDPTSQCQIRDFQHKTQQHLDSVFQDLTLTQGSCDGGGGHQQQSQGGCRSDGSSSGGGGGGGAGAGGGGGGGGGLSSRVALSADDNLMLCAVVSKTCASFSGSDSFKSSVRLPFFWCNWCPFDTESKASLLQHVVSQHCFICRFCPYLAMSRFDVINHGLKHHAQFSQFREQRLRACHLKRDLFQLHFDPRSENQPDRKRTLRNDSQDDDEGPSSPKHSRKEIIESISNTEDEERLQDQESSSESVDDLPLQFPQEKLPETKSSRLPSTSEKGCSVATHVMENVVSSSGMELDIGTDQNLTPKSRQPELCLSPAPSTSVILEDSRTCQQLHISAVKQEKKSDDADFAHALGKTLENSSLAGDVWKAQPATHTCDAASLHVKEEPVDGSPSSLPHMDPLYQHDDLQGRVLSRAVSSPPLSNIRVENLQRQFEESFGVHPVAFTSSAVSELQQSEPHPVHLIAQPSRQTSQGLVENFLISPSKSASSVCEHDSKSNLEWSHDRSSPSMLRHLLTRPLNKSAHQSSAHGSEAGHREREDTHPGEPERRGEDTSRTSATQVLDNFLLTSDKQQVSQKSKFLQRNDSAEFKESELSNTENPIISHPDARSSENVSPFIKREPEDSTEDYSAALNLMASVIPGSKMTSFQSDVPVSEQQQDVPSAHHSRELDLQDILQSSASKQEENGWTSHPSEEVVGQNPSLQTITPAEALKSYSNMSLRDLLTMDTRSSLSSVHGQARESGDTSRKWDSAGTVEGSVVWECGFCHFEDHDKAVVLAHRQQHHTQLMEEAGMQASPLKVHDSLMVSSVDEEEKLSLGEADEEGEDHVSWMDQPSTSAGYKSISQMFSAFPSLSVAGPGGLMYRRAHRMRGFRRDDDFDYLSDSTVESESDTEPDNLEDKTYEPPRSLDFSDTNVSSDEEDSLKNMKSKSSWGDKLRKRKHLGQKKNIKKVPSFRNCTHLKKGSNMAGLMLEDVSESGKEQTELYRCISCRRQPLPLAAIKDHIRYTPDSRHLLMVRPVDDPVCMLFVCPGAKCDHANTALFTECQSYLVHVLQCQGHIFDVLKSAVHATASMFLSKRKEHVGIIDCPIDNCHFVSYNKGQLWAHMDDHLSHLHTSQMLLFRSVCTVMAKMYGRVDGFDRYICYRCSSILIDLPRVVQHMLTDHRGQVRGVLIVTQKTEGKSQGIVVAIQCLKCSMRVPSLHLWFTHKCQSTSQILVEETTDSHPSADSAHSSDKGKAYNPDPSIPPFEEWIWGQQSSKMKSSTSASGQAETASQDPLPIIRSILLSHPPHKKREARTEPKTSQVTDRKDVVEENKEEEEEITAMVQCQVCQQFVAEKSFSQHGCDSCQEASAVKGEKDSEVQVLSSSKDSDVHGPSASNSSSSKQHQPYLSGDGTISHSKLLAALATRHHNNPSGPQTSQNFSPVSASRPQPASSSHPSLISLLTQSDMASLKQSTSQPNQAAATTTTSSPLAAKTTPVRDQLARFQLIQSANLASAQGKPQNSEESPDKTIRSILSQVLRQKPKDSQQSQFFSGVQEDGDCLKASGQQPGEGSHASAGVSSLPGKEGPVQQQQQQQQQQQPTAAPAVTPDADLSVQTGTGECESQPLPASSGHPSLMKFLHQQGDQVRQVLGNILDDQEESSQA